MDLSTLNTQQQAAVVAPNGAQLVIAGAGTGKTRTLVHRVAWLMEQGVDPRSIVLLTFTRRAATEMLDRVAELVGGQALRVRGGTFHGFANTALRKHADSVGYTRGFTILDSSDAQSLVGLVRGELQVGTKGKRFAQKKTLLNVISKSINTNRSIERVLDEDYPQYLEDAADIERIAVRYQERKKQQDVMDYDDLLVRLAELLRDHDSVRQRLSGAAKYVLVDEYQDTNLIQGMIASMLASEHGNLMVVGDEAQSIYRFRGAAVENILRFPEAWPNASTLMLEQNYRSTQPILSLANGVLDSASQGYDKRLFSEHTEGPLPAMVDVDNEEEQAQFVADTVLELREQGVPLQEMAVLFRSSFHANLIELELKSRNVPFRKFGGIQFAEASHVKDVFALLRIVANPRESVSWFRVLQWFEGLGAKTAQGIADGMVMADPPRLNAGQFKSRKYGGKLAHLESILKEASELTDRPIALMAHLITYYKTLITGLYEDHRKRVRDLDTLELLAERYTTLLDLLSEIALEPPTGSEAEQEGPDDEWLTLSTIHSSKGLEWKAVFVLQLGDGHFPSGYSLDDEESIEEERRLFYVAVTRAKRHLYLMRPHFLRGRWSHQAGPGCVLLDEVPNLENLVADVAPAPEPVPTPEASPELAAAQDRMAHFLKFYGKK